MQRWKWHGHLAHDGGSARWLTGETPVPPREKPQSTQPVRVRAKASNLLEESIVRGRALSPQRPGRTQRQKWHGHPPGRGPRAGWPSTLSGLAARAQSHSHDATPIEPTGRPAHDGSSAMWITGGPARVVVHGARGERTTIDGLTIPAGPSAQVFGRTGSVDRIEVYLHRAR